MPHIYVSYLRTLNSVSVVFGSMRETFRMARLPQKYTRFLPDLARVGTCLGTLFFPFCSFEEQVRVKTNDMREQR